MFSFFDEEEKDKSKSIFKIFSKYHIFNLSDDLLKKNIEKFENNFGKSYFPKLSNKEKLLHADINLKAEKTLGFSLNTFEKNFKFLQSKIKKYIYKNKR